MEARGRQVVAAAALAAALLGPGAAGAGDAKAGADPYEGWLRVSQVPPSTDGQKFEPCPEGDIARKNHTAVGRMLVVVHARRGAPLGEAELASLRLLDESGEPWARALRGAAYLVSGEPRDLAAIELFGADGRTLTALPLPAAPAELQAAVEKAKPARILADPKAKVRWSDEDTEAELSAPAGWRLREIGPRMSSIAVLDGPGGRRAWVHVSPTFSVLGRAEAGVRDLFTRGRGLWGTPCTGLSEPECDGDGAHEGRFGLEFSTDDGRPGVASFRLRRTPRSRRIVTGVFIIGPGVRMEEARSLADHVTKAIAIKAEDASKKGSEGKGGKKK